MKRPQLFAYGAILLCFVLAFGCESSSDNEGSSWINSGANSSSQGQATAAPAATQGGTTSSSSAAPASKNSSSPSSPSSSGNAGQATAATPAAGTAGDAPADPDQIGYGSLSWRYGGINGRGYKPSAVSISGLRASHGGLSFRYKTNLSAWGYGNSDIAAYACMFVQTANGSWVGGKFDWISSSRSSRDFNNVYSGYGGWNLDNVPNPCQIAFVIIDANSKRRSNVIVGTWNR